MAVAFSSASTYYTSTTSGITGTVYSGTCWVYLTTDRNVDQTLIHLRTSTAGQNAYYLGTGSDGTTLTMAEATGAAGSLAMSTGAWYKAAFVVNGTAITFYGAALAGSLVSASGTAGANVTPTVIQIGNDEWGSYFAGGIAGLKLWNAALNSTEIAAEFTQFAPVRTTNLLRYHRFSSVATATTNQQGSAGSLTATGTMTLLADPAGVPETASTGLSAARKGAFFSFF